MSLVDITTKTGLIKLATGENDNNNNTRRKAVLLFGAEWHEACPMLKMVLGALAATPDNKDILFGNVEAETATELSDLYKIELVPTIVLLVSNSGGEFTIRERLEGEILSDPSHVTLAVQRLAGADLPPLNSAAGASSGGDSANNNDSADAPDPKQIALNDRLERLIRTDTIMLFMKGNPEKPRCGFSRQAIEILQEQKVPFATFDILEDNDVRQGLKTFSDWPTYPQIYVRGELMGGLDILKETAAEGSLAEDWDIADILRDSQAAEDVTELPNDNDDEMNDAADSNLEARLKKLINRNPVMLFMKGLPSAPQCGFSRQIVEILDNTSVPYDSFNIFEDEEVRQGLKDYSDWPTYPQLYVKGELIGGLDIVRELLDAGELDETLSEAFDE